MKIKIVSSKADIRRLLDLFISVFAETPYNEQWTRITALKRLNQLRQEGKKFCFYAEEKRKVIALILCHTLHWDDGIHLIIEDLAVEKNFRRRGIATKLLNSLQSQAKKNNIVAIDILVNKDSKATEFWKNHQFQPTGYVQLKKKL